MGQTIVELFDNELAQASCSGLMDLLNKYYHSNKHIPTSKLIRALVLSIQKSDQALFNFLVSMPKILAQAHSNDNIAIRIASVNPDPYYLNVLLGINTVKKNIWDPLETIIANTKLNRIAHRSNTETLMALQAELEKTQHNQKSEMESSSSSSSAATDLHTEDQLGTLAMLLKSKITIGQAPGPVDDSHYFPLLFNESSKTPESAPKEFQYCADDFPSLSKAANTRNKRK